MSASLIEIADEAELVAAVADARASATPLEIAGGGTKRGIGRPMQTAATLSTAKLTGITLYEPSELVIGARAGTPLSDIEAELAKNKQRLAFEPPDYRTLLGSEGVPTIGAVAAGNFSGPRRIQAGAARDSLIGVRMVTGHAEAIKNGGRVMKNVTGYDLVKLSAGSWGTLGILSEVIFKVLPVTPSETTLVYSGLDDTTAVACMSAALGSPFEVSGAAHLPEVPGTQARTFLRIEGFEEQMDYRSGALRKLLRAHGDPQRLAPDESGSMWESIRDCRVLAGGDSAIWRISVAPSRAPEVIAAIRQTTDAAYAMDWGGGLIWVGVDAGSDAQAGTIRSAVGALGHATLIRAPEPVRAAVDVFQQEAAPLAMLSRGIKQAFDPDGIFNPGRMYAGT